MIGMNTKPRKLLEPKHIASSFDDLAINATKLPQILVMVVRVQ